ncbi:MAG: thioredoxin-disulfide reductase [Thermoplasmata archaeon]
MTEGRTDRVRLAIVGSGPAGLTAAIYAARANLEPLVLSGVPSGGQLMLTSEVENYPGFPEGIQGPELMDRFRAQAARFGTRFIDANVTGIDLTRRPFLLELGSEGRVEADCLILATGATARWLGLPSEEQLRGRGVSACATCDGFFFKGLEIALVGGGDSALEEALFLTKFSPRVTVIHRGPELRASRILQDRARANGALAFRFNTVVTEVLGAERVEGVRLTHQPDGAVSELPVRGLFVAIGHDPATTLVRGQLELDAKGYALTEHGTTATNVEGVFAAGDVHDHRYRQAVTAAGLGCMAALDAERFLTEHPGRPGTEATPRTAPPA